MLSATSFIYDGIPSTQYGLKIASFEDDSIKEVAYLAPAITTVKTKKSNKFFYAGVSYDDLPTHSFTILRDNAEEGKEATINDKDRREILGWLIGRKGFRELILQESEESVRSSRDFVCYKYRCIFNNVEIIYHCGKCIGFNVTAIFDSPFCYCEKTTGTIQGKGDTYTEVTIDNSDSDLWDDYTYPIIKFKTNNSLGSERGYVDNDKTIVVWNFTDDNDGERLFYFKDGSLGEEIVVDNEKKIIKGVGANLDRFSKNWLRLRRGHNTIKAKIYGDFEISYTCYMKIGF